MFSTARELFLFDVMLDLFDGGAGGGSAPGAAGTGTADDTGETKARPGTTRRGRSGETQKVLYGKQAGQGQATPGGGRPAGAGAADAGQSSTSEGAGAGQAVPDPEQEYRALVDGKYKEQYARDVQQLIDRRFKQTKGLQAQADKTRPVLELLMQRYDVQDGDVDELRRRLEADSDYWANAAEEAGMSVEQYKRVSAVERENQRLKAERQAMQRQQQADRQARAWVEQEAEAKKLYPGLDLRAEMGDPKFMSMLRSGVPVKLAYEVTHMDAIKQGIAQANAQAAEAAVTANIRARGRRPQENGTTPGSGFTVKNDVRQLTKKDRAEIARRVARGEEISF